MSRLMFSAVLLSGFLCASSANASECAARTGSSATVLLPVSLRITVNGSTLAAAEISAYTASGACAGRNSWTGSTSALTIWGDDSQTSYAEGFQTSEPIVFRIRDTSTGFEYTGSNAAITAVYEQPDTFFRTDGQYVADAVYRIGAISVQTAPATPTRIAPSEGATAVPTSVLLTWSEVPGVANYEVELATDALFAEIVALGSDASTAIDVSGLANSETHYWRVRARNDAGASAWSATGSFTTIEAAPVAAPQLTAPGDGAADQPLNPTLAWNAAAGADRYRVEVSVGADFAALLFEAGAVAATSVDVSGLGEGQRYYWRVRTENEGGEGPWSAAFEFTTIPPPPAVPVAPAIGDAEITNESVTLSWSAPVDADSYLLQVALSDAFEPLAAEHTLTETTAVLTELDPGTKYLWRVQAHNQGVAGAWSSTRSFTTIEAAPVAAPQLAAPGNGAADQPLNPTLAWNAAAGADRYRVEVSVGADFAALLFEAGAVAATSVDVFGLGEGQRYYWRIRAENEGGEGPWSAAFEFTTIPPPPAVPAAPAIGDAEVTNESVTLSWSAPVDADSYLLQIALSDAFEPLAAEHTLTETTAVLTELDPGTKYVWRVQAHNQGVAGSWSSIGSFNTRPGRPSNAPDRIRPANGAIVNDTLVTFSWTSIEAASSYRLRIYEDEGSSPRMIVDTSAVSGTELLVPLAPGKSYAWDVLAANATGQGPWSALTPFFLSSVTTTSQRDNKDLPDVVNLQSNYPNPFNPSTTIPFDVPRAMRVRMVVYDVAGIERAVLIDSHVAAGRHDIRWNADGFPSGTYFCRMEADGIQRTVTLLLIK